MGGGVAFGYFRRRQNFRGGGLPFRGSRRQNLGGVGGGYPLGGEMVVVVIFPCSGCNTYLYKFIFIRF